MAATAIAAASLLTVVLAANSATPAAGIAQNPPAAAPQPAPPAATPPLAAPAPAIPRPPAASPQTTPPLALPPASNAQPPPAKPEAKPIVAPPKNLEKLLPEMATGILGKKVWGPDGQDLGLVIDVIVDDYGYPRAAVIDFGGFLGVGSRRIAVDWRLLHFAPQDKTRQVWLSLGRAEIQGAPAYKPDGEMVGPPPYAPAPTHAGK